MLGRFLEIGIRTDAIQESLRFYEALGFVQATVGESWAHPYAVMTDGRLFLGLHAAPIDAPVLTFVLPQLAHGIRRLEDLGIGFDERHLGADVFNRATFRDPGGHAVSLLEARTFSPPQLEGTIASTCGYFAELGLPAREPTELRMFWEQLGFVAMQEQQQPFARTTLTSDLLNIALYRTRAFRQPLLTFEAQDMGERIARLRGRGFSVCDDMPDSLDASVNGVLFAPEGTRLLLLQSED